MPIKVTDIFTKAGHPLNCGDLVCIQTPAPHQYEDLGKLLAWKRSANFSEVGTGKSLVSYLIILHKLFEGKRVLVAMPPPLIYQYMTEFNRIFPNLPFDFKNASISKNRRDKLMQGWVDGEFPDVVFMSYQMLVKLAGFLFKSKEYSVLVCDEAHALKSSSSNNFAIAFRATVSLDYDFHEMTATPITADLIDAYAHIKLRNPTAYKNVEQFKAKHIVYLEQQSLPYEKIIDYEAREDLREQMEAFSVRRRQADVLSLDAPTLIEHHIQLSSDHLALYKKLISERILEFGSKIFIADNMSALRQLANHIVTNVDMFDDNAGDAPLDNLLAIIDTINLSKGKVLIFCHYRQTVRKLGRLFPNSALVYGGSVVVDEVAKFKEDPECRVMVANYKSGGAGLNLQDVCHNVIFFEPDGTPAALEQGLGRVQRKGQQHPVKAWVFRYSNTLFDRLVDSMLGRSVETSFVMKDNKGIHDLFYL